MRTPGLALALILAGVPAAAQDPPGDPERGRALAERRCAKCHQVLPGSRGPSAVGAPAFQAVADDPAAEGPPTHADERRANRAVPAEPVIERAGLVGVKLE